MSISNAPSESRSVVIFHPFDAIAGSQRVAVDLARALQASGYSTDVRLGFGTDGFISRWQYVKRFLPFNNIIARKCLYPLWLLAVIPRNLSAVMRGELVWANTVHAAPAAILAIFLAPQRVVIQIHEIEFPRIFLYFIKFARRRGVTLLCVSEFQRVELGLDAQILPNCASVSVVKNEVWSDPTIVFTGNTSPEKGFSLFIEVAKCLSDTQLNPVAFLPSPQRCDAKLLAEAESAGITARFGVTDPAEMYENGYVSLLCTDPDQCTETFSLVAVESISCLVPVVSAGTKVAREILAGSLAIDVPTRDPNLISDEIRKLLSNTERYAHLVEACQSRRQEYTFERFKERIKCLMSQFTTGSDFDFQ